MGSVPGSPHLAPEPFWSEVGAGGVLGAWAMGTVDSVCFFTCSSDHSTAVEEACSVPSTVPGTGDMVVNKVEFPS